MLKSLNRFNFNPKDQVRYRLRKKIKKKKNSFVQESDTPQTKDGPIILDSQATLEH